MKCNVWFRDLVTKLLLHFDMLYRSKSFVYQLMHNTRRVDLI